MGRLRRLGPHCPAQLGAPFVVKALQHGACILAQPAPKARNGRQRGKSAQARKLGCERFDHMLDERIAKAHAAQPRLRVADRIEDGGRGLFQIGRCRRLVQQRRDAAGYAVHQRHLHKNQRLVGQARVKEAVAAAVAVEPIFQVCPAADVVHGLVFDELFDQRGRRIPRQAPELQKGHVEPGGEQVLQIGIERHQPFVGLELGQQLGAQVHQKAHALRKNGKTLHQPRARRHQGPAQADFCLPFVGCAGGGFVALARRLKARGIGRKLLAQQQPHVAALFGLGLAVPAGDHLGTATTFQLADLWRHYVLQIGQQAAQGAGRQRLIAAPQRGLQALVRGARRWHLGGCAIGHLLVGQRFVGRGFGRLGCLVGGRRPGTQPRHAAGDPFGGVGHGFNLDC